MMHLMFNQYMTAQKNFKEKKKQKPTICQTMLCGLMYPDDLMSWKLIRRDALDDHRCMTF